MFASSGNSIWQGYLKGQLANVGKAAIWWSSFGVLMVGLLGSDIALAATRSTFNLALILASPLAVASMERWLSLRRLLLWTTVTRLTLWCMLIPAAWVVFGNILGNPLYLWISMLSLMFFDGLQVAFSNAADIDCGGMDAVSSFYDLALTDFLRYKFTTLHQLVFDSSFIFLTPPAMLLSHLLYVKVAARIPHSWDYAIGANHSIAALMLGVGVMFGFFSKISFWYYHRSLPSARAPGVEDAPFDNVYRLGGGDALAPVAEESLWSAYKEKIGEIADGALIVSSQKALKWRTVMLALETSLEDTMVSVVIPMVAMSTMPSDDFTLAAVAAVSIIAVGKLGGLLASLYAASRVPTDHSIETLNRLFTLVLLSGLSVFLVPLGLLALESPQSTPYIHVSSVLACGIALAGVFFFFAFATAPKIGFASSIQSYVTDEDTAVKVFGFVGVFVTVTDAVMITTFNLIFFYIGRPHFMIALLIVSSLYAFHGVLFKLIGSRCADDSAQFNAA